MDGEEGVVSVAEEREIMVWWTRLRWSVSRDRSAFGIAPFI